MLIVYGKPNCSECDKAKAMLEAADIQYTYEDVMYSDQSMSYLLSKGLRSLPQIFEYDVLVPEDVHIGGVAELRKYILEM